MRISILGAGNVGGTFGRARGHKGRGVFFREDPRFQDVLHRMKFPG
jgi:predicted dinucleotide-binding enzyme